MKYWNRLIYAMVILSISSASFGASIKVINRCNKKVALAINYVKQLPPSPGPFSTYGALNITRGWFSTEAYATNTINVDGRVDYIYTRNLSLDKGAKTAYGCVDLNGRTYQEKISPSSSYKYIRNICPGSHTVATFAKYTVGKSRDLVLCGDSSIYKLPLNEATMFIYNAGVFQKKSDGNWAEHRSGNKASSDFVYHDTDENFIYLRDDSRDMMVALGRNKAYWKNYGPADFNFLFKGRLQ